MKKKCVRWTKSVRIPLIAAAAILSALAVQPLAQSPDPTALPRLGVESLQYVGGFRLPNTMSNGDSFSIGGRQLAFNPAGPSLFVGSRSNRVAEVSIPGPVNSGNPDALPFARFLQPLTDPTEGRLSQVGSEGVSLEGLIVYDGRLYGSASTYYDAMNNQRLSHFSHSLQLNEPSFKGWSAVWQADRSGFVDGLMAHVPAQWQQLLGGPVVTGQCCIPIVTRTSWGPAAFSFDPSRIGQGGVVNASPLLYYTGDHPTLGQWDASSPVYGAATTMGGMVMIQGTRTALYFGANGLGRNCYGNGTSDRSLDGARSPDGTEFCYDPTSNAKGTHAYPYRYQIWAYDISDFAAVKAGRKQPWDVVPYGVWPFDLPTQEPTVRLGGVAYDPATQQIYLSQLFADKDGYGYRAIIHTLFVNAPQNTLSAPVPTTSVAITANMAAPQMPGTSIIWTATVTGSGAPYQYLYSTFDGTTWTQQGSWTTSRTFAWTPATANPGYRVGVSVRSIGSSVDREASGEAEFPIGAPNSPSSQASAVTLTPNVASPQLLGTTIKWTAAATGGVAPLQYQWWIFDGTSWASQPWNSSNTFTWTPASANAGYRIAVWVKSAGNNGGQEAAAESWYSITGPAAPAPPRVNAVTLGSNRVSPQPINTTITWLAAASGGVAPLQYQWWVFDGVNWTSQPWTAANTFAWTPRTPGANYRVAVWVRSAGNSGGQEASTEQWFTITDGTTPPPPPPATASVKLTANLAAPQRVNTRVTWTATPTGGVSPHQYQWWVFDGVNWVSQPWTTSNTFTWTPSSANANYRIAVWVRGAGGSNQETSAEEWFPID